MNLHAAETPSIPYLCVAVYTVCFQSDELSTLLFFILKVGLRRDEAVVLSSGL
jgi:hypothetical protein